MQLSLSVDSGFSSRDSSPNELLSNNFDFLNDLFVEEKKSYLLSVAAKIQATQEEFIRSYNKSLADIERTMRWALFCVQMREQELKVRLQEAGRAKVLEWERQIKVCEDALEFLTKSDSGAFRMDFEVLERYYNTTLTRDIDFIDSGEIAFEANESAITKSLASFGRICTWDERGENEGKGMRGLTPKFVIGSNGTNAGEFSRPWGVCADATGRILVSDRSNNRIQIFDESGKFLLEFGKLGRKPGEFSRPAGLVVDKKCRIIVADKDNHRIQVFTYLGSFLFTFGSQGRKDGDFLYPWDVDVTEDFNIAVSDSKNRRIQLFNEQGDFLRKFLFGDRHKKLNSPRSLSFRPDGSLLVSDFYNHRIVVFPENGKKTGTIGKEGSKPGEFLRPQGVACDGLGRFAVSDSNNHRIQIFDDEGNLLKVFGAQGSEPGQFESPQGLCFHPNGNLIVVDLGNHRVQVF